MELAAAHDPETRGYIVCGVWAVDIFCSAICLFEPEIASVYNKHYLPSLP